MSFGIKKHIKNIWGRLTHSKAKFLSCKWLEHGLIFDHNNIIRVCCAQNHEGGGRYPLFHGFIGQDIDWQKILDKKKLQRAVQRKGKIFESCVGCQELAEDYWDDKDYLGNVLLTHWVKCNSSCSYCSAVRDIDLTKENKHYDVLPALKSLIDKKIVNKDTKITIAGGEATIYPEFDEMLSFLLSSGIKNILINTSGLKYSEQIEHGIKKGAVTICVSLDAGSTETHKTIKNNDSFDLVIENLMKYSSNQKMFGKNVTTKYIILPGINDNKKEVLKWLQLNKRLGINQASLDVEFDWFHKHRNSIPDSIVDIIKFAKDSAKKQHIELKLFDAAFIIYKDCKELKSFKPSALKD